MSIRVCIQTLFALLFAALLSTSATHAQEPLKGTGFAPSDFVGDQIENAVKGAVIGDVPSDDMNLLTKDIYAKFLAGGYATKKQYSTCERVANAQAEIGLDNLNQKWWQGGWFNLGYKAIKYSIVIASGAAAAGLNDVIAEEGRGVLTGAIDAHIRAEDPEVVEINPSSRCNTNVRAVWDKQNMKITITISGNCNCRDIKPRWSDLSHDTLKEFQVDITADVVVKSFEVEEKNPLIFWRERRVKVFLGTKNMEVETKANCQCGTDGPPPSWVSGEDVVDEERDPAQEDEDGVSKPEDDVVPPEDQDGTEPEDDGTLSGIPAFVQWLLGGNKDKTEEPEDDVESGEVQDETAQDGTPWQCGTTQDVDGRSGVATYPYTDENRRDANTQCGGNCESHQACHVVPGSTGAYRDTCTYCKNICKEGEFTNKDACERAKGNEETCVATGSGQCHAVQKKKEEPKTTPNCEAALRLMLDEYGGWFDPPLTVAPGGAEMYHEHRCISDAEFDQFTRQPFVAGTSDTSIKAMCPTLALESSTLIRISGGAKGLCATKTIFSF